MYIHIPFCEKKCHYCDFCSYVGTDSIKAQYIDKLVVEARCRAFGVSPHTVFVGGGTPSCLTDGELERFFKQAHVDLSQCVEFTVEGNPNSLTDAKLDEYARIGVTRISVGVQSLNARSLTAVGRIHNAKYALECLRRVKARGFRLSADYMIGLPYQTLQNVKNDLSAIVSCGVEHISCYHLILEDGTPLADKVASGELTLPSEDKSVEMYDMATRILSDNNITRYEISNFGRPCEHNLGYWRLQNYIGLGAASHSYIDGVHSSNTYSLTEYIDYYADCNAQINAMTADNKLSIVEIAEEYIMLGLRLDCGINIEALRERFGDNVAVQAVEIAHKNAIYMDIDEFRFTIKPQFTYVSNNIIAEFIGALEV